MGESAGAAMQGFLSMSAGFHLKTLPGAGRAGILGLETSQVVVPQSLEPCCMYYVYVSVQQRML